jgi:hypothetical protein
MSVPSGLRLGYLTNEIFVVTKLLPVALAALLT